MKKFLISITCMLFMIMVFGCDTPVVQSRIPLGKIISVDTIPSTFLSPSITKIYTEHYVVIVPGTPSIPIGVGSYELVYTYSCGNFSKFTWEGGNREIEMYR